MSLALFANTVRNAMMQLKETWEKKGYGSIIGSDFRQKNRMTYAMFADDTTLVARSKQALAKMLASIRDELAKIGLHMNADKCSVQCSGKVVPKNKKVMLSGQEYPLVSCNVGFKGLGTMVTMDGDISTEFHHRVRSGWAKFACLSEALMKKSSSETKRLQLFNMTRSKTVLWCAETWNLTVKQKRKLRSVQRCMLRRIAGPGRHPEEDYVSWIRRATRVAEDKARKAGVSCWVEQYLKSKWNWAGNIINMPDTRWAKRMTQWRDHAWWDEQPKGTIGCPIRSRPGRFNRWEDELASYANRAGWNSWTHEASSETVWQESEQDFLQHAWR